MRVRFFFTIFLVLLFVSFAVIFLHGSFLQREKLTLIDQQIRETAAALVDSQLGDLRKINLEQGEDIISEELGENTIGKFFIIRNSKGDIIFETSSARILPIQNIPQKERWITLKTADNYVRVLNLNLPRINDRTLQVGAVLSQELVNPKYLTKSAIILLLSILGFGSVMSLFLTSFLLKPIARLSQFISHSSAELKTERILSPVPLSLSPQNIIENSILHQNNDEYQNLIAGFNSLIEKVNRHYKNSKFWAYQMAHELKTPLTLINLEAELLSASKFGHQEQLKIDSIQGELRKVSETISSFLSWAELENSNRSKLLFANKLSSVIRDLVHRMGPLAQRFDIQISEEITVLCSPPHLEQLILNLFTNSLKYSKTTSSTLQVKVQSNQLIVQDSGPGIPQSILDRLGEPFNKGSDHEGSGLGLAWVTSICRLYDWDLKIFSTPNGTSVQIQFNSES